MKWLLKKRDDIANIAKYTGLFTADIVTIYTLCLATLYIKELIFYEVKYYFSFWETLDRSGIVPVAIVATLFCYVPFMLGIRLKKSSQDFVFLSWVSAGLFIIFTLFLAAYFFMETWYSAADYFHSSVDFLYLLLTPVTALAIGATLFHYSSAASGYKPSGENAFSFVRLIRTGQDVVIIYFICLIFNIIKEFVSGWIEVSSVEKILDAYVFNGDQFIKGHMIVAVGSFLSVYPAFLIGVRILKSAKWFCVLSWVSYISFTYLFYRPVMFEEPFEVFVNARLIIVIVATVLYTQGLMRQNKYSF